MKKHRICMATILTILFVLTSCKPGAEVRSEQEEFQRNRYTKVEMLDMYDTNIDLFEDVVSILVNDDDFFEKASKKDGDGDAAIFTPDDEEMMLLSQQDQERLLELFELTPYYINYDNSRWFVKITFIGSGELEGGTFLRWIDETDTWHIRFKQYITSLKQMYHVEKLSADWCFYYQYVD